MLFSPCPSPLALSRGMGPVVTRLLEQHPTPQLGCRPAAAPPPSPGQEHVFLSGEGLCGMTLPTSPCLVGEVPASPPWAWAQQSRGSLQQDSLGQDTFVS